MNVTLPSKRDSLDVISILGWVDSPGSFNRAQWNHVGHYKGDEGWKKRPMGQGMQAALEAGKGQGMIISQRLQKEHGQVNTLILAQ